MCRSRTTPCSWVLGVAFSGDRSQVASGSGDKSVRIWDVASGECCATLEVYILVFLVSVAACALGLRAYNVHI